MGFRYVVITGLAGIGETISYRMLVGKRLLETSKRRRMDNIKIDFRL
jgi:hypothetical protein